MVRANVKIRLTAFFLISLLTAIVQADVLLIGRGDAQYPPFEWVEDGELSGIHIDLIKQVAQNLDIKIKIQNYPWSRGLIELKEGRLHALTFMGRSPERDKFTIFLEGNILSKTRLTLFRKIQKSPSKFNGNLSSLAGSVIAVQSGYIYTEEFDSASDFERLELKSYLQMLRMVNLGRVDYGIVNQSELTYNFRDDPLFKAIEFISPPVAVVPSYLGFSRKANRVDLAQQFAQEMSKLRESNFYKNVLMRYGLNQEY